MNFCFYEEEQQQMLADLIPVDLSRRLADATRKLDAIRELHRPFTQVGHGWTEIQCQLCRQKWPCETVVILDGTDA